MKYVKRLPGLTIKNINIYIKFVFLNQCPEKKNNKNAICYILLSGSNLIKKYQII
jgi:hypothetical protein